MVKTKKRGKVKVRLLKDDDVFGKKGKVAFASEKDAKSFMKQGLVEIIDEKRQKKAKELSDFSTLDKTRSYLPKGKTPPSNLKIINVAPENYVKWKETAHIPLKVREELTKKNLLDNIIKEVQIKVVGEEDSIRTIFLCSCGSLVANSNLTSFNLLVNSKSGSGKDFVTTATTELWSKDKCIKRTRISPTAFTYWHDANLDPNWTWDGKILVLEDISENVLNSDVFKVMQSSGSTATIVVNNKAKDIYIEGKPVIIITTAKASPDIELIRRNSICQLDESPELTKKILHAQAKKSMQGIVTKPNNNLREGLSYLQRVNVKIPFANLFVDCFPCDLIMRTTFNRFIDLIKASASLYQYQRDVDKEGFVLAEKQDFKNALKIINHLNKEGAIVTLTRDQQQILKIFEDYDKFYPIDYINSKIPLSDKWLRIQLDKLTEMGFLELGGFKDAQNRTIRHYKKVTTMNKIYVLQLNEILKKI